MARLIRKRGDAASLPSQVVISDEQETDRSAREKLGLDLALARQIAAKLMVHYPGHPWAVQVQGKQGIAVIKHPMLATNYGYVLRLDDLASDPGLKSVVKAGGELLERFAVARGQLDIHKAREARPQFNDVTLFGRDRAKYAPPRIILPSGYRTHAR